MAFRTSDPACRDANKADHNSTRKQMQFKHVTLDIDGPVAILKLIIRR
jgi:hypothetical protein